MNMAFNLFDPSQITLGGIYRTNPDPSSTTEEYKAKAPDGRTLMTVTITYTDSTKANFLSAVKS